MAHRPKLTHKQVVRLLWGIFGLAMLIEAGLAYHAWSVHDVVGAGLVGTAWCREGLITLIERIVETA